MIKIVTGQKLIDIAQKVIGEIAPHSQDLSCNNIIVVPDRFSLVAEKMVFDVLNIKATFNIHVMGITSLAKKIINEADLDCVYADGQESKFVLFRAIQKTKKDFICFSKHLSQGLVQKIQNALSLIRSSSVESLTLNSVQNTDTNTQKKLHDLALVNQKYEELLNGKLDGNNTLKLFTSIIQNSLSLKNTNFYFCGFDAFTKQGYEIIKNISKTCKNLTIGAFLPLKTKNSSIFDVEVFNNLKNIFLENNLEYDVLNANYITNLAQKQLMQNVYGYGVKQDENLGYAQIFEMSSKMDEIEFVAKKIAWLVKNEKCKFKDIVVATHQGYLEEIENVFCDYGITFYTDKSYSLLDTQVSNFLRYSLDVIVQNFDKESLLNFLNNTFVEIEKSDKNTIENYIIENNICYKKSKKLTEEFDYADIKKIFNFAKNLKSDATVEYYVNALKTLMQDFSIQEKITKLCERFEQENDMHNQKIYVQVYDKLISLSDKLISSLGDEEISLIEFYELYIDALNSIKISQVPLAVDSVYVGDASSSFFEKVPYVFVVGANQDVLPNVIKDLGLISDSEIEELDKVINLSPTVKMINKRTKFKLFDILTNATQNLYITYRLVDDEGKKLLPSVFVEDIFVLNQKQNKFTQGEIYEQFADDQIEKIMFNNPNFNVALSNISPYNQDSVVIKNTLKKFINFENFNQINKKTTNFGKNMLKNNSTKVSQIESYYTCPFGHFVKYGLKLKKQKTGKLEANDYGNFLHEFAQLFVDKNKLKLGKLQDSEVEKQSYDIFEYMLSLKEYKIILDEENDVIKDILLSEVTRFAKFVNFEQSISNFKAYKTEYKFGGNNALSVTVNNQNYTIVGIVDRIDKYENNFRIIDYKTGMSQNNNSKISNLYFGTKIQVYVYLKSIQNLFNLNPFGAFYLPITNAFLDENNKEDYKLHGYFLDDLNLVENADTSLSLDNPKSRFFEVEFSTSAKNLKSGTKQINSHKKLTQQELDAMLNYSVKTIENAINEILEGNTTPSPFLDACQFCEFAGICAKDVNLSEERKANVKVTKQLFLEAKDE